MSDKKKKKKNYLPAMTSYIFIWHISVLVVAICIPNLIYKYELIQVPTSLLVSEI